MRKSYTIEIGHAVMVCPIFLVMMLPGLSNMIYFLYSAERSVIIFRYIEYMRIRLM